MAHWILKQYIFIQLQGMFWLTDFSKNILTSRRGEFSYGGLVIIGIVGILYIANPKMFHDFFEYMIDMFFDALHSAFGDNPEADFGKGQKGDAESPLTDGIRLPGQE
jgi:hypothetical protein